MARSSCTRTRIPTRASASARASCKVRRPVVASRGTSADAHADKIAFTVQRNRGPSLLLKFPPPTDTAPAFRTGAPAAVHALYALLAPHLDRQGLPRAMLRAQLAAEFGVRVDDGAVHDDAVRGGGAPPTEAELRFAEESVRSQLLRKMMAF